jgi:uncharacterized lipoprotein YmbA
MNTVRLMRWIVASAFTTLLGACQSAPTRIYNLEPVAPVKRLDQYQVPALRVDTVNVPAGWDRIEILRPASSGAEQISDFDHWPAPLSQVARLVLSDDLDQRLPSGSVIYPRLPKSNGSLGVSVDILAFSVEGLQASMRASWLISGAGVAAAGVPSAKRSAALLVTSMSGSDPTATAHTWSVLIGQLADRIAADAASFTLP